METTNEQDMLRIKNAVEQLGEHFDAVQVFATRHEHGIEDGTLSFRYGSGNFYARIGQVSEWLEEMNEDARIKSRKCANE
jgi:hypothetical protein